MNFYEVLGVDTDADPTVVRRAYRERARRFHPDVNDHPEAGDQFRVLTRARDVLANPEECEAYDRLGHADYVDDRIDEDLPSPVMIPQPADTSGLAGGVEGTGSPGRPAGRNHDGAESSPETVDDSKPTRGGRTEGGRTEGGPSGGSSGDGGAATDGAERARQPDEDPSTGGPRTDDTNRRRSTGPTGTTGTSVSDTSGDEAASASSDHRSASNSVPPTPGSSRESGRSRPSERSRTSGKSRPSGNSRTSGRSRASGRSGPKGPQRLSGTPQSKAWRQQPVWAVILDHLAASTRWIGVVAAAGAYFAGLAGYLGTHRSGVDALAAALSSPDPVVVAGALRGERYGVPTVTTYAGDAGLLAGAAPTDAALLLAGVVLLPAALAVAVWELRRATTWRPSWLHVVGALGPAGAITLPIVVSHSPEPSPVAAVPLLADLLLLVAVPGIVVASFLLNRLLVVLPLRRREHLIAP